MGSPPRGVAAGVPPVLAPSCRNQGGGAALGPGLQAPPDLFLKQLLCLLVPEERHTLLDIRPSVSTLQGGDSVNICTALCWEGIQFIVNPPHAEGLSEAQ